MLEELNSRFKHSIGIKLLSMTMVGIALLIPLFIISEFVGQRSKAQDEAAFDISQSWSDRQTLAGPFMIVPFTDSRIVRNDEILTEERHAYFLPDVLDITGEVIPEKRYRGIYEVIVYTANLHLSGQFAAPDFSGWSVDPENIRWEEARLAFAVTDMRGIKQTVMLDWGTEELEFSSGVSDVPPNIIPAGISVPVDAREAHDFSFNLELDGSRALQFVPVGKQTNASLSSEWPSPSFNGAFLPDERDVTDDGFEATWHVLDLNRPYGQRWRDHTADLFESAFGLSLVVPVDHYLKSVRATRYAFLVIIMTLLSFFLIELRLRKRGHPFQYILVGVGLCLFYLLLLSLSEHMTFDVAYIIAGVSTVVLIAQYVRYVFKAPKLGILTAGVLSGLYGFVFLLLQLEDYALLVGSIGLFLLLALTMFLTRNFSELTARYLDNAKSDMSSE